MKMIEFDNLVARQIIEEEFERVKQQIIAHIRANGQNASGRTIKSMHVTTTEDSGTLWGRKAFGTLETGRRGGKVPYGFRGIIYQWMQDKGIHGTPIPYLTDRPHKYTAQERGDMSMAGAIATAIAKRGTSLFRTGGRADVYSNVIPDTMSRLGERLIFLISQSIDTIHLNNK